MAAIDHLLEQSVIADLNLDVTLAVYSIAKHDESDVTDAPVRLAVTATDRGDFCAGSGIKRVHLEVQIRVNAAADGISEDLLDTLAEKVGDRLQPSTTVEGVIGREPAFSTAALKVFGILSSEPSLRVDDKLIRQRAIARTFICSQLA